MCMLQFGPTLFLLEVMGTLSLLVGSRRSRSELREFLRGAVSLYEGYTRWALCSVVAIGCDSSWWYENTQRQADAPQLCRMVGSFLGSSKPARQ